MRHLGQCKYKESRKQLIGDGAMNTAFDTIAATPAAENLPVQLGNSLLWAPVPRVNITAHIYSLFKVR